MANRDDSKLTIWSRGKKWLPDETGVLLHEVLQRIDILNAKHEGCGGTNEARRNAWGDIVRILNAGFNRGRTIAQCFDKVKYYHGQCKKKYGQLLDQYAHTGASGVDRAKKCLTENELLSLKIHGIVGIEGLEVEPSVKMIEIENPVQQSSYIRPRSIANQLVDEEQLEEDQHPLDSSELVLSETGDVYDANVDIVPEPHRTRSHLKRKVATPSATVTTPRSSHTPKASEGNTNAGNGKKRTVPLGKNSTKANNILLEEIRNDQLSLKEDVRSLKVSLNKLLAHFDLNISPLPPAHQVSGQKRISDYKSASTKRSASTTSTITAPKSTTTKRTATTTLTLSLPKSGTTKQNTTTTSTLTQPNTSEAKDTTESDDMFNEPPFTQADSSQTTQKDTSKDKDIILVEKSNVNVLADLPDPLIDIPTFAESTDSEDIVFPQIHFSEDNIPSLPSAAKRRKISPQPASQRFKKPLGDDISSTPEDSESFSESGGHRRSKAKRKSTKKKSKKDRKGKKKHTSRSSPPSSRRQKMSAPFTMSEVRNALRDLTGKMTDKHWEGAIRESRCNRNDFQIYDHLANKMFQDLDDEQETEICKFVKRIVPKPISIIGQGRLMVVLVAKLVEGKLINVRDSPERITTVSDSNYQQILDKWYHTPTPVAATSANPNVDKSGPKDDKNDNNTRGQTTPSQTTKRYSMRSQKPN